MGGSVTGWLARESIPTLRALRLPADRLRDLSAARLARTLAVAQRTVFHRSRLAAAGFDPDRSPAPGEAIDVLRRLEPVTKHDLRAAGDDALVGGAVRRGWRSTTSSGSTGEPFRVYYDPRAWAILKHLVKWRGRMACGLRMTDRIAVLDAVAPERAARSFPDRVGRRCTISVFEPAEAIADRLGAFRPRAVYGPPSTLAEVASVMGRAAPDSPTRLVFVSSELLIPSVRRRIADAFGCPVLDVYGCSETKEIAFECTAGRLHVNSDVVHVEVIDDAGQPASPGVEGDLVATLLVNAAMPLLRYRPGDRATLGEPGPCDCGLRLPTLGGVTGRTADLVELGGDRRISPYALTCAVEVVPGIRRFQIVQSAVDRFDVRVQVDPETDRPAFEQAVRAALQDVTSSRMSVAVEHVESFPRGARGKFRVVEAFDRAGRGVAMTGGASS